MEGPSTDHLGPEQFEMLASNSVAKEVFDHLQSCDLCREKAKAYEAAAMKLNRLNPVVRPGSDGCSRAGEWPLVASGAASSERAREFLLHASQCDHCGPLVRTTHAFDDEVTPEEEHAISELIIPESERTRLATIFSARAQAGSKPFGPTRSRWMIFRQWPALAYGLGTAALVIAVTAVLLFSRRDESADQLLAQAYSEQRTLEPRFAGAKYGPVRIVRGGHDQSSVNKPQALLDAEALIHRHLLKELNNVQWLDAQGKADLLEANYDAALQTFRKALDIEPNSPALQIDAASAYFERAELADRPDDYVQAIDLLSKVLDRNPYNAVALYNRALANEKMFFYQQALSDWNLYLRLDSRDGWAEEARQRRDAVQKKLERQKQGYAAPLLGPAEFSQGFKSNNQAFWNLASPRTEDYLDAAIREWLPQTKGSTDAALQALAQILSTQHGDQWLLDLIRQPRSTSETHALQMLATAAKANNIADFIQAREAADEAQRLFKRSGNRAGALRAQFETVYALQLSSQEGAACLAAANSMLLQLAQHAYPWLEAQLHLEKWNCQQQIARLAGSAQELDTALSIATKSGYGELRLRALAMAADYQDEQGNLRQAFTLNDEALARYWEGAYRPYRAYQIYTHIALTAERTNAWSVALFSSKETVIASQLAGQPLREATARYRVSRYALMLGDSALADAESNQANELFAGLPQNEVNRSYQADQEIRLAGLAAQRGEADRSRLHLLRAQLQLPNIKNYFIALRFYAAWSELALLRNDPAAAEKALRSAVAAAEWGLGSLKDEEERAQWVRETGSVYRSMAQRRWEAHDVEGALKIWEWYRSAAVRTTLPSAPGYTPASIGTISSLPRMDEVSEVFPTLIHETVVSYMQLPAGIVIWAVDDRGVTAKWVGVASQELEKLDNRFRDACAHPDSNHALLRSDARTLYDLLIAPIAERLSPQRALVLELDESLAQIPVEALMDPMGHYLAETFSIVLSPGILYRDRLRSSESFHRRQPALVVGSPALTGDLSANLEPLEDASREAREIAAKFDAAVLLSGAAASVEKVEEQLPRASIFHFAGHALTFKDTPVLLLASAHDSQSTGILDAQNLPPGKLRHLQLAVLSACSTAKDGKTSSGLETLVKLFLRARVPHVVAARWNVDSGATAEFMRVFYDALLSGHSVPSSLQRARMDLQRLAGVTHPYYWAAFEAFGR